MGKNKDDDNEPLPPPNGGNGQSHASAEDAGVGSEAVIISTLQHDLTARENTIRELEASLELEGRVSATLRESLRKLTDRIARLEESFEQGGRESTAGENPSEDAAPVIGAPDTSGAALADAQDDLARVTAERDALRAKLRALERMQIETVTLPEDVGPGPASASAAGPRPNLDVQPSIDELLESMSSIRGSSLSAGLEALPGSGPGESPRDEPWSEMIAPEIIAPEAFEAEDATSRQRRRGASTVRAYGFLVSLDGRRLTRHVLRNQVTTIGRSPSCDIQVNAGHISRMHARILSDDSSLVLEDAGSKNGIKVNDDIVDRHVLKSGDVIHIGPLRFIVEQGSEATECEDGDGHSRSERESTTKGVERED